MNHAFRQNLLRPGLYAITDSRLLGADKLLPAVEAALKGGATVIQYRDKSDDAKQRLTEARALASLCARYQRPLLINDDIDLARSAGAQGVHLGQGDGSVTAARAALGDDALIGVTCHDRLELALQAEADGADYVAFGAFFPSSTKPGAVPAPLSLLDEARRQLRVPIVAIGGITVDNAHLVIEHQAAMVAVIHSLFAAVDIEQRARAFCQLFEGS